MSQEPFVFPNLWRPFPFDLWVLETKDRGMCWDFSCVWKSLLEATTVCCLFLLSRLAHSALAKWFSTQETWSRAWIHPLVLHTQSRRTRNWPWIQCPRRTPKIGQNDECGLIYKKILLHFQIVKRLLILPKIHWPAVLLSTRRHGSNYYSDAKPGAPGQHSASEISVPEGSRAKYCEVLGDHSLAGWSLLEECHEYLLVSRWECDIAVAEFPTALTLSDMQMSPFASSTRTMATGIEPRP